MAKSGASGVWLSLAEGVDDVTYSVTQERTAVHAHDGVAVAEPLPLGGPRYARRKPRSDPCVPGLADRHQSKREEVNQVLIPSPGPWLGHLPRLVLAVAIVPIMFALSLVAVATLTPVTLFGSFSNSGRDFVTKLWKQVFQFLSSVIKVLAVPRDASRP